MFSIVLRSTISFRMAHFSPIASPVHFPLYVAAARHVVPPSAARDQSEKWRRRMMVYEPHHGHAAANGAEAGPSARCLLAPRPAAAARCLLAPFSLSGRDKKARYMSWISCSTIVLPIWGAQGKHMSKKPPFVNILSSARRSGTCPDFIRLRFGYRSIAMSTTIRQSHHLVSLCCVGGKRPLLLDQSHIPSHCSQGEAEQMNFRRGVFRLWFDRAIAAASTTIRQSHHQTWSVHRNEIRLPLLLLRQEVKAAGSSLVPWWCPLNATTSSWSSITSD
jgi:hypothetical protein